MGSGDSHLLSTLLRGGLHGGCGSRKERPPHIPKGCLAVVVGQEGEEQQRFVVPVAYLRHPLFARLLKEAEDEYGFEQRGAIALPCHVEDFRSVQGLIDRERLRPRHIGSGGGLPHHHHHSHLLHHNMPNCFRA